MAAGHAMLASDFAPIDLIDRPDYLPFWTAAPQRAADQAAYRSFYHVL